MRDILRTIKEEFKNEIMDVDELEDEIIITFQYDYEIKINEDKKIDIYKRYVYCDSDDENMVKEQEEECRDYRKLLFLKFGEDTQTFDDSCIGCTSVDEIVGYFNKEFNIQFIREFINISQV